MTFKKFLIKKGQALFLKKGQALLEYFLLFSIIICLTLLSVSALLPRVRTAVEESVQSRSLLQFRSPMFRVTNADNDFLVIGQTIFESLRKGIPGLWDSIRYGRNRKTGESENNGNEGNGGEDNGEEF